MSDSHFLDAFVQRQSIFFSVQLERPLHLQLRGAAGPEVGHNEGGPDAEGREDEIPLGRREFLKEAEAEGREREEIRVPRQELVVVSGEALRGRRRREGRQRPRHQEQQRRGHGAGTDLESAKDLGALSKRLSFTYCACVVYIYIFLCIHNARTHTLMNVDDYDSYPPSKCTITPIKFSARKIRTFRITNPQIPKAQRVYKLLF